MIDVGQAIAYLDLDSGKYTSGMKSAIAAAKDLGNASLPASAKLKGLGSAMGRVGRDASALTLAIAAVGAASVTSYAQLDTAARKVSTVADGAILSLQGIKDGTRELSNELRTMPTDVAAGMYDMISANGDTANAFDYTAIAVKAAKGGFTDTATAVDGLTSVMNAYALTGEDAMQRVSDQMLTAQNYGKTTFGAIAASIGGVIPLTAQLKTGTDELFASLATLTKQGIGTSEAVTGLKAVYAGVLKPTTEATKAAKAMGLDFTASALRAKGLGGFLEDLVVKTGGSADSITKLFGSVEALNTVLALTSEAGQKDFAGAMGAMQSSAGATEAAYQTMTDGIEGSFDHVKVAAVNLASTFGEDLAPTVEELADWLAETTEWFQQLPPDIRSTIVTVAGLAAALGPVLIIGGQLVASFGALAGVMSGPVGWIALGIAGVTALAIGLEAIPTQIDAVDQALQKVDPDRVKKFREGYSSASVNLDVDVSSNGEANVTASVSKLKALLNDLDVLSDEERNAILLKIGEDLNPIKSALSAAGLTDGQADAVQTEIDAALGTLREKLSGLNILDEATQTAITSMVGDSQTTLKSELKKLGITGDQAEEVITAVMSIETDLRAKLGAMEILSKTEINQIIKMVGDGKTELIAELKKMGLTDAEAQQVANAINEANGVVTSKVSPIYDKIYQALTDGKPDTEEQSKALQAEIQSYYDELIGQINLDTETKLANLKAQLEGGFITIEQYQSRADAITTQNGELIASVQKTCADSLVYVTTMSGESTTAVEKSLTDLEALKQRAEEVAAETARLTEETQSSDAKRAQTLVKAGVKVDEATQGVAFSTAGNEKKLDTYNAEQNATNLRADADKQFEGAYNNALKDGASDADIQKLRDTHDAKIAQIEADLATEKARIQAVFLQSINELMAGLSGQNPEMQAQLQGAFEKLDVADALQKALESGDASTATKDSALMDRVGKALGIDDPASFLDSFTATGDTAGFASALESYIARLVDSAGEDTTGLETSPMATAIKGLMDEGLLDGLSFDEASFYDKVSLAVGKMNLPQTIADALNQPKEGEKEGGVSGTGQKIVDQLAGGINGNLGVAIAAATGLASTVSSPLVALAAMGLTAGGDAIQGLINGAEKKRKDLMDTFRGMARAAYQAAKDELGIASPSKVFAAIGLNTVTSLADSVDRNRYMVEGSMRRLTDITMASPAKITGAGALQSSSSVTNNNINAAPVSVTFPGDIHVNSDAELRSWERRQTKFARDLQYGLGVRNP